MLIKSSAGSSASLRKIYSSHGWRGHLSSSVVINGSSNAVQCAVCNAKNENEPPTFTIISFWGYGTYLERDVGEEALEVCRRKRVNLSEMEPHT